MSPAGRIFEVWPRFVARPAADSPGAAQYEAGREWARLGFVLDLDELRSRWEDAPDAVLAFYEEPRKVDAEVARGFADELARLYLSETGLTSNIAIRANRLIEYGDDLLEALARMPEEDRLELQRCADGAEALARTAMRFLPTADHLDLDADVSDLVAQFPQVLTDEALHELRDSARRLMKENEHTRWLGLAMYSTGGRRAAELRSQVSEMVEPYRLTAEEQTAAVQELLGELPTLADWLKPASWLGESIGGTTAVFEGLQKIERETAAAGGPLHAPVELAVQLGDRVLWPQAFQSAHDARRLERQAQRVAQGRLAITGDENPFADALAVNLPPNQLAAVSSPELRVAVGTLRLFSSVSDDGILWRRDTLPVAWRTFCQACDVDPRQTPSARTLFMAAQQFARRTFRGSVELRPRDAKRSDSLALFEEPLLSFRPEWSNYDDEVRKAVELWQTSGEWKGRPPDVVRLKLADWARVTFGAVVLPSSFLSRLDAGAKNVRGARKSFENLDALLYLEMRRRGVWQAPQKSARGNVLSFVDRERFLLDFYGENRVADYRASGRYRSRIVAQYLRAVEVLVAGGVIFPEYELEKPCRNGLRDVFEVVPEEHLRLQSASPDSEQGVLF